MIISLWNNKRLVGKELAWELQKPRTRDGRQTWEPIKYYRRLGHALAEVGEQQVRLAEGDSLLDAITAVTEVSDELQRFVDEAFESIARPADQCDGLAADTPKRTSMFSNLEQK